MASVFKGVIVKMDAVSVFKNLSHNRINGYYTKMPFRDMNETLSVFVSIYTIYSYQEVVKCYQ